MAVTLIPKVVAVAMSFVGQTEKSGNSGFADSEFQLEMQKTGWYKGAAWCAFFVELVYKTACLESNRNALWNNIENLFSGSAIETLSRFEKKGYTVRSEPKIGDMVVWRFGAGPSGHMGIVVAVGTGKTFTTIEGNTSSTKSDTIIREGEGVFAKTRKYGTPISNKAGSFNLLGFVAPVS